MWVKVHSSSRKVIAICDDNLIGKRFEQGLRQLQVTESFFKGQKMSEEEVLNLMKYEFKAGSTFNIVGKDSISLALKIGIIEKEAIVKIKRIPFVIIIN